MRSIWKMVAFLGRYGHQGVAACLELPVVDLCDLAEEVGLLLRDEGGAMRGNDG